MKNKKYISTTNWFYLLRNTKGGKDYKVWVGGKDWPANVVYSSYEIGGEKIILLFFAENNFLKAKKILDKAKRIIEKMNSIRLEIIPIPEDWFFLNNIIYTMRINRKMINRFFLLPHIIKEPKLLNLGKLKQEVNEKINKNKSYNSKYEKLMDLIKKLEKQPKNKKLLVQIVWEASCLDIFISNKIKET